MDADLLELSSQVYSDLTYLKSMNQVTLQYLVGEVCRNIIHDNVSVKFSNNLDIISRISVDLENEGVVLSNQKILRIVLALRSLSKVYYRLFTKRSNEPLEDG